jgi:hypothetical protein
MRVGVAEKQRRAVMATSSTLLPGRIAVNKPAVASGNVHPTQMGDLT